MSDAREALPAAEDDAELDRAAAAFADAWTGEATLREGLRAALDAAGVSALRAEVERLREVSAAQPYETERELAVALDEARRELADLRARIEALATWRLVDGSPVVRRSDLRALLAESGEPPGEPEYPKPCSTCGTHYDACTTRIRSGKKACCGTCGCTATHEQNAWEERERKRAMVRPAPVVPDSPEQDERITAWNRIVSHPFFKPCFTTEGPLIDAMIDALDAAVVGQGVTVDWPTRANEASLRAVTVCNPSASGVHADWCAEHPSRAAVRPSGQEGS